MRTNNRLVLPLIVILLVISLPFTVVGLGTKIYKTIRGDNPQHLHKIDNKLYYYENNKLVGTYDCSNENCDSAYEKIDDPASFAYLHNDTNEPMGLFSDGYIFIQDGDDLVLYSLNTKIEIGKFKSFKNYGTNISESYIVLQNDEGQYGLFDIQNVIYKIQNSYTYLGVSEDMISKPIEEIRLLAKDDNDSYIIIDGEGNALSTNFTDEIHNYDDMYVYTIKDDLYHIFDYNGIELIESIKIAKYEIYNDNYIITSKNGNIYIYPNDLSEATKTFKSNDKKISYSIENDILTVLDDKDKKIGSYNFNPEQEEVNDETLEE